MRNIKLLAAVVMILAFSAPIASAHTPAKFTASAVGSLTGKATQTQIFTITSGEIKCTTATTSGVINSVDFTEQHVTVHYTNCTAFGIPTVHISDPTYLFTANGQVHLKNTVTITVTGGIFGECTVTITSGQTVGTVSFVNLAGGKMKVTPHVTGIAYHSTGGVCGAAGTNGTYTGDSEVERVGGGSISWDETKA